MSYLTSLLGFLRAVGHRQSSLEAVGAEGGWDIGGRGHWAGWRMKGKGNIDTKEMMVVVMMMVVLMMMMMMMLMMMVVVMIRG